MAVVKNSVTACRGFPNPQKEDISMNILKRSAAGALAGVLLVCASALTSCEKDRTADLLTYRYNYDLSEYISLAEYKGIPAECSDYRLSDEEMAGELEQQILLTRYDYARDLAVTDRGAAAGDKVTVDYSASENGNILVSDAEYVVNLGFGTVPAEFEEALTGAKAGDVKSFDCTYPEEYSDAALAGKTVSIDLTVSGVSVAELPDYGDEFVRAYLGYESAADFEAALKKNIEDNRKDNYYMMVDSQTWTELFNGTTVKKFPEKELKEKYDGMVSSVEAYAKTSGISFAGYVEAIYGMTEEEFYDYAEDEAETLVKDEMIKYAVARAENVTISDEEYEVGVRELAARYEFDSVEDFTEIYDVNDIREIIMFEKVHEVVADLADVTYTE